MNKIIAVLVLVVALSGCNSSEKLLCHSWKLADIEFDESAFNLTKDQKPAMVKQLRDSCLFNLKKDHTYWARLTETTDTGTWQFNAAKDTLYTKVNGRTTASKVNTLTATNLNLFATDQSGTVIKFYLVPVK
jgi:hypothetical protein